MARIKLTARQVDRVVQLAKNGASRAEIEQRTKIGHNVISSILAARGVAKSRPDVVKRDRQRLRAWLGQEEGS